MTEVRLEAGQPAPAFTLADQDGSPVSLADYAGDNVIVYFYPAAMTPGCTTEACDFRDNLNSLASSGYKVIGISKDAPAKNKEFQEQERLNFPLLSDEDLALRREEALRQDGHRRHPVDLRAEPGRHRAPPALQRQGDRPRRLAPQEARPGLTQRPAAET